MTGDATGGLGRFRAPEQTAPAYSLPGFFGQGGQTFVAGEGRLARPRFEATASISMGYDDNIFQTPSGGDGLRFLNTVLIDPGSPGGEPIIEDREVFLGGGAIGTRPVVVGFTEARQPIFEDQVTVLPPGERKGSLLTRANFGFQTQLATRRTLFTLDLYGGGTYNWDKKEDPLDRSGGIGANFLYRITPRLQFTASVNSAYLSQPDFTRANTPQRNTGDLVSTISRTTLSYRVTPRFSMSVSGSLNSNYFFEELEQIGNYQELIFGTEARYLWSPRYTFLVEYRHSMTSYEQNQVLNSSTDYLLVGTEFIINRRLSGSLRLGASMRSFELGAASTTAPYFETSLNYRTSSRSVLQWTNRFGFEEPNAPNEERLVLRSGLVYSYAFTPRLRGSASLNFLRTTSSLGGGTEDIQQLILDSTLALDYTLTEDFSLNCSYSFTNLTSTLENTDYYRNRIFVGAEYRF